MDKYQALMITEKYLPGWVLLFNDSTLEDAVLSFLIRNNLTGLVSPSEAMLLV